MLMRREDMKAVKPINLDRCYAASDRQRGVSRRTQALLAAAGMEKPARRWFVVTVRNGEDRSVAEQLERSGVEVWMPVVMMIPTRRGGMPKKEKEPQERLALKGYVFVKVAATTESWSGLATVKGVLGMLGRSDGRPLPIADAVVDLFRRYFRDDPEAKATVTDAVRQGDEVVVTDGPFRSFPGTVKTIDEARGRAVIMLGIFGHENPVNLHIAQIAKL